MKIRLAQRTDAASVCELLNQLGYPQDDPSAVAHRLSVWAEDSFSAVYVAEAGGDVLGVIAVDVRRLFEKDASWGRITTLVVVDRARGCGVGSQLVAAAELFAARLGCHRMEVTSGNHRQDAHGFYRRRGYSDQTGKSSRFLRELPVTRDHQR